MAIGPDPAALAAWDNTAYAMNSSPAILERFGFPVAKIPAVVEAIRTHQPSSEPTRLEGTILRDADILEQLGAVGILRMVCKVGRDTRYRTFHDVLQVLERQARELPGQIRLPTTRRLSEPRLKVLQAFLAAARLEADGQPL